MEKYLRLVNTFILIGILVILVLIWIKLPHAKQLPTIGSFSKAKGNATQLAQILTEMPMVKVFDIVPVDVQNNSLDVNVENYALDVNVTNSYLSVRQW